MLSVTSALAELIDLKYKVDGNGIRDPYCKRYWQVESSEDGSLSVWDASSQLLVKEANAPEIDKAIQSAVGR